ncbi:FAD-dependent monooxygenase [Fictibacillus terranigra]|uniref:FAD-dependent monooxygenase n=1 Tax=Fictibacillus terranigra TaxID=3058424 RepID=A0ABT8E8C3_9BACL|nr:FAD-dependent monooxygenase [Fictibacillus sp. CENA-BCM004]MDN4074155.1 FAD-dependent monooxygenase [Fictibacillus sp. CENA-BCM004]
MNTSVLIVGAGPTGLVLALQLKTYGIPFRIIEKHSGPGKASRALVVHARILEFYRQLGIADEVVSLGIPLKSVHLREGLKEKAEFKFSDLGKDISPYPFALSLPQDVHEEFLVDQLNQSGIGVEWNTELISFSEHEKGVRAIIKKGGQEEAINVDYLCGCDGAHSTVRHGLHFDFPGGTYDQLFYVADLESTEDEVMDRSLKAHFNDHGFCLFMPVRTTGMIRLIGIIPRELEQRSDITFEEIQPYAEQQTGLTIKKVNWFSTYHVHHRVSEHFRKGRCFIAGDAGHIHSPAGGQGMNTGIGDAVNLSWKLAAVLHHKADSSVLDTYETERIAFARTLVSTTDRAFQTIVGRNTRNRLIRNVLIPYAAPILLGFAAARRVLFNTLSQTRIEYRDSELSTGIAGKIRGGDRLPWVQMENGNNFDVLKSMDWQLHIYGRIQDRIRKFVGKEGFPAHSFPWHHSMDDTGLKNNSLYLIRPDGYVAYADEEQNVEKLKHFIEKFNLSPFKSAK